MVTTRNEVHILFHANLGTEHKYIASAIVTYNTYLCGVNRTYVQQINNTIASHHAAGVIILSTVWLRARTSIFCFDENQGLV